MNKGNGWKKWGLALFAALVFGLFFPQPAGRAMAQEGDTVVPMPGFVVTQHSKPNLMLVTQDASVWVLPLEKAERLGGLEKGTYVNAWGQTDTGWYFVECAGTLGYVWYEAAVPLTKEEEKQILQQREQARQAALQQEEAARQQALQQAALEAKQAQIQAAAQNQPVAAAGVVFIGDSRMVTLQEAVEEEFGFCPVSVVAQSGARYDWLESNGIPRADRIIGKGTKVILNMGVNDMNAANRYRDLVNYWAAVWSQRGAQVYYASVNPVYPNIHNKTEEQVSLFNQTLRAGLIPQVTWIDSNTYLKQTGVKSNDGIHYQPVTDLVLYHYYMTMIGMA